MRDARLDIFRAQAAYNRLANSRLYDACAGLSPDELAQNRQAFFRSILGTLNHLLVSDNIWMTRFEGGLLASTGLDEILHTEFAPLRAAREQLDARIEAFFESADNDFLQEYIAYRNNEGRLFNDPMPLLVMHFFNHQTHHRGQAHAMLTQTTAKAPVLDLHRVLKPFPDSPDPL